MALSKAIAARISAYFTNWVDPDDFAVSAENNLIYGQRHHVGSKPQFGFYVISGKEKSYPLDQLTNLEAVPNLGLVLPYDAVTLATIPIIWLIETMRGAHDFKSIFGIDIVGATGKDQITGDAVYVSVSFGSTADLLVSIGGSSEKHQNKLLQVREKSDWSSKLGVQRSINAYITDTLGAKLGYMKQESVTLSQVEEYAQSAKRYKIAD